MSQNTNRLTQYQENAFAPSVTIDPRGLFYRMKKGWYWFVLSVLVAGVLAWLQVRYTVPKYSTSASFIIEDPTKGGGVTPQDFTRQFGFEENNSLDDELNVLTSRAMMAKVVRSLGLQLDIAHIGEIRNTDIYASKDFTIVSTDTVNLDSSQVEYGAITLLNTVDKGYFIISQADTSAYEPGDSFMIGDRRFKMILNKPAKTPKEDTRLRISHYNPDDLAEIMRSRVSVARKGESNTVLVYYTDTNPQRAADVVNELIALYTEQIIDEKSKTGAQTVAFIDERLQNVTRELNSVEASLSGLREKENIAVDNSSRGTDYLAQLNQADAQLSELEVRRALIESLQNQLNTQEFKPLSVASEIIDGTLTQLVTEYNALIFKRQQTLESATEANPIVATSTERLGDLKQSLVRSINTLYRETTERIRRIEQRIQPIEAEIRQIPDDERRLLQIMRQQQIKQNLFIYLMEKREEAAIAVAAQIPNTRVIDAARPNLSAIFPKPNQNYLGALAIGFLVPGLFFFLREALNKNFQLEKKVAELSNVPIVGRIANADKGGGIVVAKGNRSWVAEMFRMLRTNLKFLLPKNSSSVILFTSAVSGEGKTFTASNLAASLAMANKKTIVVGADMRKPQLYNTINQGKKNGRSDHQPGLSTYLIEEAEYEAIIQATEIDNLFLIDSGAIPPDPSELLLRPKAAELLSRLRADYEYVIIDAPPIGMVTDAQQLAEYVDITLYVIRLGYTPQGSINVLNEATAKGSMPNLGIVLNGLQPQRDYGYGFGKEYYQS